MIHGRQRLKDFAKVVGWIDAELSASLNEAVDDGAGLAEVWPACGVEEEVFCKKRFSLLLKNCSGNIRVSRQLLLRARFPNTGNSAGMGYFEVNVAQTVEPKLGGDGADGGVGRIAIGA